MKQIITLVLLSPFIFVGLIVLASEYGGEVVELETHDERGGSYSTSVWIVDLYGDQWIRAGDPDAGWLKRIERFPEVHVTRFGEREVYTAEVVPDFAERINDGMLEKYGLAERLISTIHDNEAVVAIRLQRP